MFMPIGVSAYHIVGADFYYTCVGPNTYDISLTVYRDCNQTIGAPFDPEANISIFDSTSLTNLRVGLERLPLPSSQPKLPVTLNTKCPVQIPNVCVEKATYIGTITLPAANRVYMLTYQRCCRNATLVNLVNPDQQGASFVAIIPETSAINCNNSPRFTDFPPVALCHDIDFTFDHSATDADGDSLVYKFCEPFQGADQMDPYPDTASRPAYPSVNYGGGYTYQAPLGGYLTLDPITGLLSGSPQIKGQFVVGVCVEEWRNGVRIGETKRDFQFNVVDCVPLVNAATAPELNDCSTDIIQFSNTSSGAIKYFWDFGVPGLTDDTAVVASPSFLYPDTGTYNVMLIINKGFNCPDTAYSIVRIYPGFDIDVQFDVDCYGEPIQFFDVSFWAYGDIERYFWDFGDGNTSTDKDPIHIYEEGGLYTVRHSIRSNKGCVASMETQVVVFERPDLFASDDQNIYLGESALISAVGASNYLWLNDDPQLKDKTSPTQFVEPTETTTYYVQTTSIYGCSTIDSVTVYVLERPTLLVPTAFSPNGDGLNDRLFPITDKIASINAFQVFNRWGEMVYETSNFESGWDGTFRNVPQEIGNYAWFVSATSIHNDVVTAKGNVTLVR